MYELSLKHQRRLQPDWRPEVFVFAKSVCVGCTHTQGCAGRARREPGRAFGGRHGAWCCLLYGCLLYGCIDGIYYT